MIFNPFENHSPFNKKKRQKKMSREESNNSLREPLIINVNNDGNSVNGHTIAHSHENGNGTGTISTRDINSEGTSFLSNANESKKKAMNRLTSLDMMKGFIIIIMAWDHAKDFLVDERDSPKVAGQSWDGPPPDFDDNARWFVARTISNICAPGFYFTMGTSIVLFAVSRREKYNWDWYRIVYHFLIRGLFFIVVVERFPVFSAQMQVLVDVYNNRPSGSFMHQYPVGCNKWDVWRDAFFSHTQVMTGLGMAMLAAAAVYLIPMQHIHEKMPLLRIFEKKSSSNAAISNESSSSSESVLTTAITAEQQESNANNQQGTNEVKWYHIGGAELFALFVFFAHFAVSNIVIINAQDGKLTGIQGWPAWNATASDFGKFLTRFIAIPGKGNSFIGDISYPAIPWTGITILGMGFGYTLNRSQKAAHQLMLFLGLTFFFLFMVVREFFGDVGNYRGWPRHERDGTSWWILFFSTDKYPPDMAFALITLSVDFLLIWLFSLDFFQINPSSAPITKPLLVLGQSPMFFYIAHFLFLGFTAAMYRVAFPPPHRKLYLQEIVPIWMFTCFILYFACQRFAAFKATKSPESLWRLL